MYLLNMVMFQKWLSQICVKLPEGDTRDIDGFTFRQSNSAGWEIPKLNGDL